MSVWGKIIGGAAGFAMGGPLGALLGTFAGHALDKMAGTPRAVPPGHEEEGTRQIAFTIAVIGLAAKMAKADGQVTRDEIDVFKRIFEVPPQEARNVGRVFDLARRDVAGYEGYARQVGQLFVHNPHVLEELLDALFLIAMADKVLHPAELEFLRSVAGIFGFSDHDFERIRAAHLGPDHSDPFEVLGVTRAASDDEIKRAWRAMVSENHPDRLMAQGMPPEFIAVANDKLATINDAYDRVSKERGIN